MAVQKDLPWLLPIILYMDIRAAEVARLDQLDHQEVVAEAAEPLCYDSTAQ